MINHGGPDPGHRARLRPRVLDPGAAAGRPGQHRQPGDVVRPDAADRRPQLGERGADQDGRAGSPRSRRTTPRRRCPPRSPTTAPTTSPTGASSTSSPRSATSSSCRSCRPGSARRVRRPVGRSPTTRSPASCVRSTRPTSTSCWCRSPTPSGPPSRGSSRAASATGTSPASARVRPRPGSATTHPVAGSRTAAATCPPYPLTPRAACSVRSSRPCSASSGARLLARKRLLRGLATAPDKETYPLAQSGPRR